VKPPTVHSQVQTRAHSRGNTEGDGDVTPTPSRPHSPGELNGEEEKMVRDTLTARTPRTSYYAMSSLEPDVANSHFHDMDLCVLLHQESDPTVHEVVRRALRKAVRQRIKKLGMLYDIEVLVFVLFLVFYSCLVLFALVYQAVQKVLPRSRSQCSPPGFL
jgi:hypothetical protein